MASLGDRLDYAQSEFRDAQTESAKLAAQTAEVETESSRTSDPGRKTELDGELKELQRESEVAKTRESKLLDDCNRLQAKLQDETARLGHLDRLLDEPTNQ